MGQQQSQTKDEMLFQQVSNNNVEGIKSLLRQGALLESVDKLGRTPLTVACSYEHQYDAAKTLLQLGSNVNVQCSGCNGGTPLHHAAKNGLENTVKLLLAHGANPLVLDDDIQTALEVARDQGHCNTVRAIEKHICLFSGWMRESYGPSFLELLAPQFFTRKVWVVIVPTGSRNPTKLTKLELAVYDSLQDAQPKTVMALWKANLEESKSDDSVITIDNSTGLRSRRHGRVSQARRWVQVDRHIRLKLAAETKGDKKQLKLFCKACKGTTSGSPEAAINEEPMLNHPALMGQELKPSVLPLRDEDLSPVKDGECVICVDASAEAVCVPCGHVAGCVSCLKDIKDSKMGCPVCRANIDQVIKLYRV